MRRRMARSFAAAVGLMRSSTVARNGAAGSLDLGRCSAAPLPRVVAGARGILRRMRWRPRAWSPTIAALAGVPSPGRRSRRRLAASAGGRSGGLLAAALRAAASGQPRCRSERRYGNLACRPAAAWACPSSADAMLARVRPRRRRRRSVGLLDPGRRLTGRHGHRSGARSRTGSRRRSYVRRAADRASSGPVAWRRWPECGSTRRLDRCRRPPGSARRLDRPGAALDAATAYRGPSLVRRVDRRAGRSCRWPTFLPTPSRDSVVVPAGPSHTDGPAARVDGLAAR